MRSFLIVLLVFSNLSAHAYVYSTAGSKYHTPPVVAFTDYQSESRTETAVGKVSSAILSPIGIVVGGLLGGLASGLEQGVNEGTNKQY